MNFETYFETQVIEIGKHHYVVRRATDTLVLDTTCACAQFTNYTMSTKYGLRFRGANTIIADGCTQLWIIFNEKPWHTLSIGIILFISFRKKQPVKNQHEIAEIILVGMVIIETDAPDDTT